mgnify:FL=1|jgi:hypothetical protein|tara:strand:- start:1337 stop:1714 length:378 start_codon:yes stop_codon:yes gene_type:complete
MTKEEENQQTDSQLTKAGKLAMELSQEKKRLKKDLADLQTEVEDLTPTTPTGTRDWYVKWASMSFAVLGVFLISAGLIYWGQLSYIVSSIGWVYVGMAWGDRAIMIGSAIAGTAVAMNFVQGFII